MEMFLLTLAVVALALVGLCALALCAAAVTGEWHDGEVSIHEHVGEADQPARETA